ncbi:Reticulon-domain-containing protein [Rhypophila decipiens]|uniref:Reticulon-like protein n=1 Tax=Rhypophila decipiens TaxID=261697 RepID=A0AAN6YG69_9PEZI|nr:Reticulon-domain-containing protein [Rhypophila decipiens]
MNSTDATAAYNSVANGPVAQNVLDQHQKTTSEFSNLAAARQTPANPAATGQPLTHYHSFFSELLSWNNPRASGIAYATVVSAIFAARYLDLLRYGFKLTWVALGITIAAEIAGKAIMNNGFATQVRPRKYYTVPKETLDAVIGDVNELINFFVIEAQRVLFVENLYASLSVALGALLSYYLIKIVPSWGLALIATTVVFFAPLLYTSNQELIDEQLKHVSEIVNAQTSQLRTVAQKQATQASQLTKEYVGDYSAKAQALIKGARQPEHKPEHKSTVKSANFPVAPKDEVFPVAPKEVFPDAPKDDLKVSDLDREIKAQQEPLIATL